MKKLIVSLALVCAVSWFVAGSVSAMGGPAPQDKYKLEILKVELISGEATTEAESTSAEGKKVLLVVAPKSFDDTEFTTLKDTLTEAGLVVSVASIAQNSYGIRGTKAESDLLLKNANADDYDAVIICGGFGVTTYNHNQTATGLVNKAMKGEKVIGALDLAPIVLINGGALQRGNKAAVSNNGKRALKG
ncbi:MAG: DJ-1/PfpI family protein, partial [Candidatus Margulisbacteria bacterium]|nr:DJ-1/PfpI family protein [Candidatus Margulisiibacteriota bacterium]